MATHKNAPENSAAACRQNTSFAQTRPEHTPRHIKIPQDVKHDERRTKRDPVIERQVHDMVAQTDVLRRKYASASAIKPSSQYMPIF